MLVVVLIATNALKWIGVFCFVACLAGISSWVILENSLTLKQPQQKCFNVSHKRIKNRSAPDYKENHGMVTYTHVHKHTYMSFNVIVIKMNNTCTVM